MVLADLADVAQPTHDEIQAARVDARPPVYKPLSPKLIAKVENSPA